MCIRDRLRAVSEAWLAAKSGREKRFSVGYFDEAYLRAGALATVWRGERLTAFANLWQAGREELSVDLMRYGPDGPSGLMDYLFVQTLLWGRDRGFEWFNLGMAPLAGLENRSFAPLWNRFRCV